MTIRAFIDESLRQGFALATDGVSIQVRHEQPIPESIRERVKADRAAIIGELMSLQDEWLARVASHLQQPPERLISGKVVDQFDLMELWTIDPALAASQYQASPLLLALRNKQP